MMMELVKEIPEGPVLSRQEYWSVRQAVVRIIYATRYCMVLLNAPSGMNITRHIYRKLFWFLVAFLAKCHMLAVRYSASI